MSTFMANKSNIVRKWYVVDAAGKPLGHTAVIVADLLRGKRKTTYTPHADCGDNVIVINAGKATLSGNKLEGEEARAGHARGCPRHDAPEHHHQGFPQAPAHLRR